MEELFIGSEITLKVVENESCDGCFFDELESDTNKNICPRTKCITSERKERMFNLKELSNLWKQRLI